MKSFRTASYEAIKQTMWKKSERRSYLYPMGRHYDTPRLLRFDWIKNNRHLQIHSNSVPVNTKCICSETGWLWKVCFKFSFVRENRFKWVIRRKKIGVRRKIYLKYYVIIAYCLYLNGLTFNLCKEQLNLINCWHYFDWDLSSIKLFYKHLIILQ